MDQKEAAERRSLRVKNPISGNITQYDGGQVYSIGPIGVVVLTRGSSNILFPWHTVVELTYHHMDESARKAIQGW